MFSLILPAYRRSIDYPERNLDRKRGKIWATRLYECICDPFLKPSPAGKNFASMSVLVPSTTAECYWPNGDVAGSYVSCPDSKACCLKGEACLSNGLCYAARYNIAYRGACTDSSWPIADCPRVCYTSTYDISWELAANSSYSKANEILLCFYSNHRPMG